ncbi:PD40 domain-containing protein [Sulfidibacter corallicola]|uniref:PD40 domain-containing protein n=1 Tax=Sulfidibacter corallicola TaxID=2818388 RepID=A0A8A4TKV8_SULCO|nr:hypothetical protein [Sulfidibacter corallicola]QTD49511.1 PD40 domain-containing protein [Sulfidibacter corallicola]
MLPMLLTTLLLIESGPPNFHRPMWSPDGKYLAFMSDSVGNWELFLWDQRSPKPTRITESPSFDGYAFWAPDGKRFLYIMAGETVPQAIYLYDLTRKTSRALTKPNDGAIGGKFSPDGKSILHSRDHDGVRHIYVMDEHGGNVKRLTHGSATYHGSPIYDPAGERIAYVKNEGTGYELRLMDPTGKPLGVVTRDASRIYGLWWSPDGKWLAYNAERDGAYEIFKIEVDGGKPIRLTHNRSIDHLPVWLSQDRLVFTSYRGGPEEVYEMNADGSMVKKVAMPTMPTK